MERKTNPTVPENAVVLQSMTIWLPPISCVAYHVTDSMKRAIQSFWEKTTECNKIVKVQLILLPCRNASRWLLPC